MPIVVTSMITRTKFMWHLKCKFISIFPPTVGTQYPVQITRYCLFTDHPQTKSPPNKWNIFVIASVRTSLWDTTHLEVVNTKPVKARIDTDKLALDMRNCLIIVSSLAAAVSSLPPPTSYVWSRSFACSIRKKFSTPLIVLRILWRYQYSLCSQAPWRGGRTEPRLLWGDKWGGSH
jgi:hypothetical protein